MIGARIYTGPWEYISRQMQTIHQASRSFCSTVVKHSVIPAESPNLYCSLERERSIHNWLKRVNRISEYYIIWQQYRPPYVTVTVCLTQYYRVNKANLCPCFKPHTHTSLSFLIAWLSLYPCLPILQYVTVRTTDNVWLTVCLRQYYRVKIPNSIPVCV